MNVYFNPGDVVTLKQDVEKPKMIVKNIIKVEDRKLEKNMLYGIVCMWFSTDMKLQTGKFNTKDLKHYE